MKKDFELIPDRENKNSTPLYLNSNRIGLLEMNGRTIVISFLKNKENLKNLDVSDFYEEKVNLITCIVDIQKYPNLQWLDKNSQIIKISNHYTELKFMPDLLNWEMNIKFSEFNKLIRDEFAKDKDFSKPFYEGNLPSAKNYFLIKYYNKIYKEGNIQSIIDEILDIIDKKFGSIFEKINKNTLVNTFNFPPEIQHSCEQYLIYFGKFLEDIGIQATAEIQSNENETIFSVIPKNKEEALSNIQEALNIYISLPSMADLQKTAQQFPDIGVQQLMSNVLHLQSQLILANATLQAKDATIKSLNFTNYQQQSLIEKLGKEKEEDVIKGVVKVSEFKTKGVSIDLAEILRRIKRILNQDN